MKIDRTSWLGKWYLMNCDYFEKQETTTDICTFTRKCFITGPLKALVFIVPGVALLIMLVIEALQTGLIGSLIFIGVTIAASIVIIGLVFLIIVGPQKIARTECYKSWKDKWCAKVDLV